jgi:cytochrome c peroxidase
MNLRSALLSAALGLWAAGAAAEPALSAIEALGQRLFFDAQLSSPPGQSCASCHDPGAAFTDPRRSAPTSPGVLPGRFGNRNSPTAMYAAFSPAFHFDAAEGTYLGGLFLDGRVSGLESQAQKPFLNPLEMANPDPASVVGKVRAADYAPLFEQVFGAEVWADTGQAFAGVAAAIAAFERTAAFAPFSSKYDAYLAGRASLSPAEARGLAVFEDPAKGNCAACHPNRPSEDGTPPLFTDFSYDNIGIPRNVNNPFYRLPADLNPQGLFFVDAGLGQPTGDSGQNGKFKVPTLRNIQLTAPYMHNGYFASLEAVVAFYNTRDAKPLCYSPFTPDGMALALNCWPAPESAANVNRKELGNLKLSANEAADLVAFLGALNDGYGGTECLLDWFEAKYPNFLFPPGAKTESLPPYAYRYYSISQSYAGVSSADGQVYYLGKGGGLISIGEASAWLAVSGC